MITRSKTRLLVPVLALSISLGIAASAQAQDRRYDQSGGTSTSLQVAFGSAPHWTGVRGTRVQEIRPDERPGYDMFRYNGRYYARSNNQWYTSRRGHGQFNSMDERNVPRELSRVPRDHWQNYPSNWTDANGNPRHDQRGRRPTRY